MKLSDMKEMVNCRKNLVGFLHFRDAIEITSLLRGSYSLKSFNDIANKSFELYESKVITNKSCTKVIEIICRENTEFRTESHRFDGDHKIFNYDEKTGAYVFLKTGGVKEFNLLNHYLD